MRSLIANYIHTLKTKGAGDAMQFFLSSMRNSEALNNLMIQMVPPEYKNIEFNPSTNSVDMSLSFLEEMVCYRLFALILYNYDIISKDLYGAIYDSINERKGNYLQSGFLQIKEFMECFDRYHEKNSHLESNVKTLLEFNSR